MPLSTTASDAAEPVRTKRGNIHAQLMLCEGCCCGRTDRGFAPLPKDRIKSVWKQQKLNRFIQLTISGCLGPCDVANVACILLRDSKAIWLGQLDSQEYDALVGWAMDCQDSGCLLPLPTLLLAKSFDRFERVQQLEQPPMDTEAAKN